VETGRNDPRSINTMFTPPHSSFANFDDFGVNLIGTNLTPAKPARFNASASFCPSIHGAPTTSNGVSVPRPTETLVVSSRPIPGYNNACVRLLRFGDGFTQVNAVPS